VNRGTTIAELKNYRTQEKLNILSLLMTITLNWKFLVLLIIYSGTLTNMFNFSIDGTSTNRLGRFVNDSPRRYANCSPKAMFIEGCPRVLLFASKLIPAGTELRYDYGGTVPWRKVYLTY